MGERLRRYMGFFDHLNIIFILSLTRSETSFIHLPFFWGVGGGGGVVYVSLCFKPSQLQRIISGLKETSIKRYIVERTDKAEIRPEEQSGKGESCRDN